MMTTFPATLGPFAATRWTGGSSPGLSWLLMAWTRRCAESDMLASNKLQESEKKTNQMID